MISVGANWTQHLSSLDCQKTLSLWNTWLPHWVDFERERPIRVTLRLLDDKVVCLLFFLAESVLFFLVGEALHQRSLFNNCKNHFRKRSTWPLVQLYGYCFFGVSWTHCTWLDVILCLPIILNWIKVYFKCSARVDEVKAWSLFSISD